MTFAESASEASGIALHCDLEGRIQLVLRDDLSFDHTFEVGRSIVDFMEVGSVEKARNLLSELREKHVVYGWELNVEVAGRIVPLHFAGTVSNESMLLVAYTTPNLEFLYESIAGISSEQSTLLRSALKEQMLSARSVAEREAEYLHQLTRVNNDLVNLQRELTNKNRELERLNALKNELLGMAAHDLRNPLGIVLSYSKFLLSERLGPLNEKQSVFLTNIQSSSTFMLRMLEDLLDISQIEAGKLRLDIAAVDLVAQIDNNVTLNGVLSEKKGIALEFVRDVDTAVVMADSAKIEQVLNNLISNAVKFSQADTTVVVTLARTSTGFDISVRDHGQGIPADERDRLFRPFSKTSVKSTAGEKSTGLGLAIVQKIVSGHGGRVWVESEVGKGTTFHVALPSSGPGTVAA